jgi:hypothetical protein
MKIYKPLLLIGQDYKTVKGQSKGYLTGILYLASGKKVCPNATKGCLAACLVTSGKGIFNSVKQARKAKTDLFMSDLESFMSSLIKDINKLSRKANKKGLIPVVRLNGTSDISWENVKNSQGKTIFDLFPDIQFYDYTPSLKRVVENKVKNYYLLHSTKETMTSEHEGLFALKRGYNTAIVFDYIPENYRGYKVINGDETDLRFLDDKGVIVGLTAKGKAKKDSSGFVKRIGIQLKGVA